MRKTFAIRKLFGRDNLRTDRQNRARRFLLWNFEARCAVKVDHGTFDIRTAPNASMRPFEHGLKREALPLRDNNIFIRYETRRARIRPFGPLDRLRPQYVPRMADRLRRTHSHSLEQQSDDAIGATQRPRRRRPKLAITVYAYHRTPYHLCWLCTYKNTALFIFLLQFTTHTQPHTQHEIRFLCPSISNHSSGSSRNEPDGGTTPAVPRRPR